MEDCAMNLTIKGLNGEDIKKSEVVIRENRRDLESRAEVAEKLRRLKKRKRSCRDPNAIKSLNSYYKLSKYHHLEKKRVKAEERRSRLPIKAVKTDTGKYCILAIRNKRKVEGVESQKILKQLNLSKPNIGKLLINDCETQQQLQRINPFIYYGFPSLDNLRILLKKRGTLVIDGEDKPIDSNLLVENLLGKFEIICIEDIVYSLWNGHKELQIIIENLGCLTFCDLAAAKGLQAPAIHYGNGGDEFDRSLSLIV